MSKIAVVYWSGTGNTKMMAEAIFEGAKSNGAEVDLFTVSEFNVSQLEEYDTLALGCPAMGAEVLEEEEFQPMFDSIKYDISNKKIFLFGSFDWGDGEWMRNWEDEVQNLGANLLQEGLIINLTPDAEELENCKALGASLV
ncbi:MAG: flavodoxin [Bacillota bacterium]|nr:flavodoxin [Bacillota bacterium]